MPSSIDLVNLSCTGIDDKIDVIDKNTTKYVIYDATEHCMNVLTEIQLSLDNDTFWLTYDIINHQLMGIVLYIQLLSLGFHSYQTIRVLIRMCF